MRFDRLITLGLVAPLQRATRRVAEPAPPLEKIVRALPVLMYHSISDDAEAASRPYYRVCTSPRRFADHLQWLAKRGWTGVTLRQGIAALAGKAAVVGRPVVITFDDGFLDFQQTAFPLLARHNFKATMYLPTAFIGRDRNPFKSRACMSWEAVQELNEAGIEFGSHTVNHAKLLTQSWPEIEAEIQDSKSAIEDRIETVVESFAYPYAFPLDDRVFVQGLGARLQRAGYRNCVTTVVGRVRKNDNPFVLKRLPVNEADDEALFAAKLEGAYDWIGTPQRLFKHLRRLRSQTQTRRNSAQAASTASTEV